MEMAVGSNLPGGIVLGTGESVVRTEQFSLPFPFLFLKTKIVLTNRRIAGESPNVVLGFIPVGSNKVNYPLRNVASTQVSTSLRFFRLIIGVILALLGLALIGQSAGFIIILVIGIIMVISSFQLAIAFTNNAGQGEDLPIWVLEKGNAQAFLNQISTTLAEQE